jgi:hypothetical protein
VKITIEVSDELLDVAEKYGVTASELAAALCAGACRNRFRRSMVTGCKGPSKPVEFTVSDRAKLDDRFVCPSEGVTPRLKSGRLYCVQEVSATSDGDQLLRLVGVKCTQNGADAWLRSIHFTKAGQSGQQKGAR